MVYLRDLARQLGFRVETRTRLLVDSDALYRRTKSSSTSSTDCRFQQQIADLEEMIDAGDMSIEHIAGTWNLSDTLTKVSSTCPFETLRKPLTQGWLPVEPRETGALVKASAAAYFVCDLWQNEHYLALYRGF